MPYRRQVPSSASDSSAVETQDGAPATAKVRGVAGRREFIVLVTALMASSALAIDLMLPAFPEMREEFNMPSDSTQVGLVVTVFFFGLAVGPWLYGPASDRYGRRAPLFIGMSLYVLSAVLAAFAPSWGWVIVARFIWGLGAAAARSLSTAMIRDRYEGSAIAQLMSSMVAIFLLVPILAPSIGALLIRVAPWRIVFLFPAGVGLLLMLWCRRLPETLPIERRRPFTWSAVSQAGKEVVTHRQTISYTIAMTFLFGVMTTYLASSEVIVEDVYDYGSWFPLIFGGLAVIFAINSLNNARIVKRIGISRLLHVTSLVGVFTTLALVVVSFTGGGKPNIILFYVALALVVPVAQGLIPNLNAAAMMPVPHVAGTATAIIGTVSTAGAALLGSIATGFYDGTVRPFVLTIAVFIAIGVTFIMIGSSSRHSH